MSYYSYLLCIFIHKANVPKFSLVTYSPAVHLVCPQTKLLLQCLFLLFFFLYFSDYYDYIHITQLYKHKYDEIIYVHARAIYTETICKLQCASASQFIFHFCLNVIFSAELSFMNRR